MQFHAAYLYTPPIDQIITAFKLGQQEDLCASLAHLMVARTPSGSLPDLLIPVPAHPKRLWERGYNPPLLVARQLGKLLHIPVDDHAVKRIRHTPPQRLQTQQERRRNLKNAFECVIHSTTSNVALIDDVITTGETLRAIAAEIAPCVKSVICWAIAESPGK